MIDTLVKYDQQINDHNILNDLKVAPQSYALITMHRSASVDSKDGLEKLTELLNKISA